MAQSTLPQRLAADARRIGGAAGVWGIAGMLTGVAFAVAGTAWAVTSGVPTPIAAMAGFCTLAGGVALCAALAVLRTMAVTPAPRSTPHGPNHAAWKLVSKFNVSDAAHLWCELEPGSRATEECVAWASAMLDAIKRGELSIVGRAGASPQAIDQERSNPTWQTQITREALQTWASAHGHCPRFLAT